MQSLSVKKGKLVSEVHVPPSKSYANRALIIASLIKDGPLLKNLPQASDVTFLLKCLKEIGLNVSETSDGIKFTNLFPECESNGKTLHVGEGGTTARFLAAMLLLGKQEYKLILGERLKARPWNSFLQLVKNLGGKASLVDEVLTLQGPLRFPSSLEVDCSETTQFASAFQLLKVKTKCSVVPVNLTTSQSYWAMTEALTNDLLKCKEYSIPLDWSSASYPLAFAALNQTISFPGLKPDSFQADSKFYNLLQKFNCIEESPKGLSIKPVTHHESVSMDVSDCLDLVPTLGYFLGHIEGDHVLHGVENLVHKESNRLDEVIKLLRIFNREASTDGSKLFIKGSSERINEEKILKFPDDHRMVMVGTLFLLHHGGGEVAPKEAVNKSYPDFYKIISC